MSRVRNALARGMWASVGLSGIPPTQSSRLVLNAGTTRQWGYTGSVSPGAVLKQSATPTVAEPCDASSTPIGVCLGVDATAGTCVVQHTGVTPDLYSALTAGAVYYAAAGGGVATTGEKRVGTAISARAISLELTWAMNNTGVSRLSDLADVGSIDYTSGRVLVGTGSAYAAAWLSTVRDADGDTLVQLEKSADEDRLRLDLGGRQNVLVVRDAPAESSGTAILTDINHTVVQTGTAGYTALDVDVTETSTGSGARRLLNLSVGGTSRFSVSRTGATTIAGSLTVGELILPTLASNPLDETPGNRPAASAVGAIGYYEGDVYVCTNASTPVWKRLAYVS